MSKLIDRLKAARRVSAPLVAIETADPAATIQTVTAGVNSGTPFVMWNLTDGMVGIGDAGADAMQGINADDTLMSEIAVVKEAEKLAARTLLFVHFDSSFWSNPAFVQQVWSLRDRFKRDNRMLVLMAKTFTNIPERLQGEVIVLEDPLPDAEQANEILDRVIRNHNECAADARANGTDVPDADVTDTVRLRCVSAIKGMHDGQAELTLQMCLGRDGKMDVDALFDRQRKTIEQTPGVTVFRNACTFNDVGGLDTLKEYTRMIMNGRNPAKLIVWLDEIATTGIGNRGDLSGVNQSTEGHLLQFMQDHRVYGVLLAGVQGAGKSEFCKAVGGEFDRLVIRLDLDACKGSLVGQSEAQLRAATRIIEACSEGDGSVFWIATANSIDGLSGPMRNRFVDTFFLDLPTRQERQPIWDVWMRKMGLDDKPYQDDEGWNGRNIWQCCDKAYRMNQPVADVAKWIIPVGVMDAEAIERLRKQADGRYLSASHPGVYRYRRESVNAGRHIEV